MATSSDIITLSAQSRVPPLGAPISLNTVCTLYGGGGRMSSVEARAQWQYSTAIDFLHEDRSVAYHSEASWGLGGIYLNIIS